MTVEQDTRQQSGIHSAPRRNEGPRLEDPKVNKAQLDRVQREFFLGIIKIGVPVGMALTILKALHLL